MSDRSQGETPLVQFSEKLTNSAAFGNLFREGMDLVEQTAGLFQASAEAIPGQGVRRIGGDIAEGSSFILAGRRIRALDLLVARTAGLETVAVRRPRLRLIDIPAAAGTKAVALVSDDSLICLSERRKSLSYLLPMTAPRMRAQQTKMR